jgi:hypothetical protein
MREQEPAKSAMEREVLKLKPAKHVKEKVE